ncbi:class Ib ribonucleoside-diphosphate reductase assembly flavoprotein NrdI [Vagococcus sp. JNUCC 83]
MKLVFFSLTGQTRRFINKLNFPFYEIDTTNPFHEMNEDFLLIVPTYDKEVTEVVNDFIEYKTNQGHLLGVAGSGNLNFGDLFVFTAKDIAKDYNIPLIFSFEFSGTDEDVKNFKKVVNEFESKRPD